MKERTFEEIYREAEERLYRKGYYVCNMIYDNTLYEVTDADGNGVMDCLSLHQLECLANLLTSQN